MKRKLKRKLKRLLTRKNILIISIVALFAIIMTVALVVEYGGKGEHACSFSEWKTVTEPDCTTVGERKKTCIVCGNFVREEIRALGHDCDYSKGSFIIETDEPVYQYKCQRAECREIFIHDAQARAVDVPPSCTASGYRGVEYAVSIDGWSSTYVRKDESFDMLPHVIDTENIEWTWDGYTPTRCEISCSLCSYTSDSSDVSVTVESQQTSCYTDGYVDHIASAVIDGVTYTDTKTELIGIGFHDFDYANGVWTWDGSVATFTVACKNDISHTKSESVTAKVTTVEPTCELEGYVEYSATVLIGEEYYDGYKRESLGGGEHKYDLDNVGWDIRTDEAYMVVTCLSDPTHVLRIKANSEVIYNVYPDCENYGSARVFADVEYGGEIYSAVEILSLAPLGHLIDHDSVSWEWSGYESATFTADCVRGELHSMTLEADMNMMEADAGCTEGGYNAYIAIVNVSGVEFTDERREFVESMGHDYMISDIEWNEIYAEVSLVCVNDPTHRITVTPEISRSVISAPTCTEDGETRLTVNFEIDGVLFVDSTKITVPKLGHSYSDDGVCGVCGEKENALVS